MSSELKVVDLFAGVGGLSCGFKKADCDIIAAVEFDKQIAESYQFNHKTTKVFNEDIKEIVSKKKLNKYKPDIVVGGPPCQGFSMAGARIRKHFKDDPRNNLFTYYFELVRQLKPSFFLFENVKGILTMEDGNVFKNIIKTFSDKDKLNGDRYYIYYKLFKTSDFGIPQKRERLFIIGTLNEDINFEEIIKETKREIFKKYPHFFDKVTTWDAISNLKNSDTNGMVNNLISTNPFQEFLAFNNKTTNQIKPKHSQLVLDRVKLINEGENYTKLDENIKSVHSGAYGRLSKKELAPTITTRFDTPSGGRFIHPVENRALTPREGARIQSFPDNFEFKGTKTSIYKQIGNAVPPKLAFFLAEVLKNAKGKIKNE